MGKKGSRPTDTEDVELASDPKKNKTDDLSQWKGKTIMQIKGYIYITKDV